MKWYTEELGFQPSGGGPGRIGSQAAIEVGKGGPGSGGTPSPGMIAYGQRHQATTAATSGASGSGGVATGARAATGAASKGSAAGGPVIAAAYLALTAPSTVIKKIGRTAASGIDEVDY
jgi:hypothetical protein